MAQRTPQQLTRRASASFAYDKLLAIAEYVRSGLEIIRRDAAMMREAEASGRGQREHDVATCCSDATDRHQSGCNDLATKAAEESALLLLTVL